MSRRKITAGSTSVTVPVFVQDTSSTVGVGLGSLVFNTSGLAAKYRREGQATWTTITLSTATVGTWASGGFISDGGPVTGGYEAGIPDAVLAAGAKWAEVVIYGATSMLAVLLEFELDTLNYQAVGGKVPATVASTDVTGNVAADLQTIKTQTVTCAGGVTVPAATLASTTNITAGTMTTTTNLTNAPTVGDFTSTMKTSIGTAVAASAVASVTAGVVVTTNNDKTGYSLAASQHVIVDSGTITTLTNLPVIPANWLTAAGIASGALTRAVFAVDTGLQSVRSNTAAGGTSSSITLDGAASAVNSFYNGCRVYITGGTGVGQERKIRTYTGSSKVAGITPTWITTPDNTSTFSISGDISVWDEVEGDHVASGTTGASLNAAGSAGDPWTTVLPGAYGAGTAGYIVGTNIDLTVSSRLAPTVPGRTLDVSVGGEAGLDWANVGTPGATVGLTATTLSAVTNVSTVANVSTLNGIANNVITAASLAADAGTEVAAAIWDLATVGHTTSGTFGAAMNAAGAAGDPWSTSLPGAYSAGTAGHIVGTSLPDVAPGALNGLLRAGSNAATTFASGSHFIGTVDTITTYTGDTPQTGDGFARLGAAGAGLTALGDTRIAHLDADVSSRLATAGYTAPPTVSQIWTSALTESYAADGVAFTPAQGLFMIWSALCEFAIAGMSITCKKLDGSTTAMIFTIDDATNPTSRTRTA